MTRAVPVALSARLAAALLALAAPLALSTALVPVPAAYAQAQGIPVEIQVLDPEGNPIPTAVVRHPEEMERHPVNTMTGAYRTDILYLPDGSEQPFFKGMTLNFEVSAPGYVTANIAHVVRKRRNNIQVTLEKMQLDLLDDLEEPVIQFGRDRPIDGATAEPAQ